MTQIHSMLSNWHNSDLQDIFPAETRPPGKGSACEWGNEIIDGLLEISQHVPDHERAIGLLQKEITDRQDLAHQSSQNETPEDTSTSLLAKDVHAVIKVITSIPDRAKKLPRTRVKTASEELKITAVKLRDVFGVKKVYEVFPPKLRPHPCTPIWYNRFIPTLGELASFVTDLDDLQSDFEQQHDGRIAGSTTGGEGKGKDFITLMNVENVLHWHKEATEQRHIRLEFSDADQAADGEDGNDEDEEMEEIEDEVMDHVPSTPSPTRRLGQGVPAPSATDGEKSESSPDAIGPNPPPQSKKWRLGDKHWPIRPKPRDPAGGSTLRTRAGQSAPGGGIQLDVDHRHRHISLTQLPTQPPPSDNIDRNMPAGLRVDHRAQPSSSLNCLSDRVSGAGRAPGRARPTEHARSHRVEPYNRPRNGSSRADRQRRNDKADSQQERIVDDAVTRRLGRETTRIQDSMHIDYFGKIRPIPDNMQIKHNLELLGIQEDMARTLEEVHEHGERNEDEGRKRTLAYGMGLDIKYAKRLLEIQQEEMQQMDGS
ncbi:hypothetical protein FB567DRAFT_192878 [Paraphoma chrysanthemicola]|uniref:Uncharacterized protein n=1 Tax=Paraphoma chrysanthemicola TaxID=798071 RepID=A0A8K0QWX5_9PLEO|nr:hypothetical protein FB567DRAFT_192878 [Paraphoma chrysanthemicola]